MMLKYYLFVIFCIIQVRGDNVLDELRNKTHEITLKYDHEFEKQKQNDPNIDYLRGLHGKLIQVLSNNNYEEPKCDKVDLQKMVETLTKEIGERKNENGNLQKMVETLRNEIEERKNENENLQKVLKTLQTEIDERKIEKEDLQKKVEEQEKKIKTLNRQIGEINEIPEESLRSNSFNPNKVTQAPPTN